MVKGQECSDQRSGVKWSKVRIVVVKGRSVVVRSVAACASPCLCRCSLQ